jgi:hypothetical protein
MSYLPDPYDVDWKVNGNGYGWAEQAMQRYDLTPEKIEMMGGKLCGTEADRLRLLGLLLENCGAEIAVRYGDPEVWRRAVAGLGDVTADLRYRVQALVRQWDDVGTRQEAEEFYGKWAVQDFFERTDGFERTAGEAGAAYPATIDWPNSTWYRSELTALDVDGDRALAQVTRKGHVQRVVESRMSMSEMVETWALQLRQGESWLLAEAALLSRNRRNDGKQTTGRQRDEFLFASRAGGLEESSGCGGLLSTRFTQTG